MLIDKIFKKYRKLQEERGCSGSYIPPRNSIAPPPPIHKVDKGFTKWAEKYIDLADNDANVRAILDTSNNILENLSKQTYSLHKECMCTGISGSVTYPEFDSSYDFI